MNDFYDDDENYAEFIEDEEVEDIDDSFLFLDESEFKDSIEENKADSSIPDARYVNKLKKKIRNKLKKRKKEEEEERKGRS